MKNIKNIIAREVLDSRGLPTVEAEVHLYSGVSGRSIVPSGSSIGENEAIEIRDNDYRYFGKGVKKAVYNINNVIKKNLLNMNPHNQKNIDQALINLDGTKNKGKLGANAILAVSMANLAASSNESKMPLYCKVKEYMNHNSEFYLPTPMINIINGGLHANNTISFQEFMIIPIGANSFSESLLYGTEIFYILKSLLKKHGHNTNIGDEGGFSPNLRSNQEAIEYILLAIEKSSLSIGKDIFLGVDIAGNELYKKNKIFFFKKNYASIIETFMELMEKLVRDYPIIYIEDPFCEKDFFSWQYLNTRIGKKIQLVGDDIFVTNPSILKLGIENKLANSLLIKLNQIGTVTEAVDVIKIAKKSNFSYIISHRSGETEDTFISDFSVGVGAKQVKFGSLCRSERIAKYNRLLRIEKELGSKALYSGKIPFENFFK